MTASRVAAVLLVGITAAVAYSSSHAHAGGPVRHRGLEKRSNYKVLAEISHDPRAFTQGLVYADGIFYEGTGLYGQSQIRKVEVDTGRVLASARIENKYFGEGITVLDDKLYQLTWRERQGFVYNKADLSLVRSFGYDTVTHEGWGITTDGKQLIVSDGSEWLFFWDKDSLAEVRRVKVVDGLGAPVNMLNELEYVEGYIWANVWMADDIVQIDPATGKVVAFYDFSSLYPDRSRRSMDDVLNGIAYDSADKVFYLTGKRWPKVFKVKLCDAAGVPAC